ncbi:MAG: UDP-N-acetylmuramate--L-alanine ligase [Acidobacteria bacterium]|nr:MAG: UDP-N-acetylmuramate--L-alanine ligase [Acidobacteriota bacterium]
MFAKLQRVHFVGIGGIGMSGIAEVLLNLGYTISGSDLKSSPVTERLASMGAVISEGHRAENVVGADVVVISSAVSSENPEVLEAKDQHIPVIPRAEMLAELMRLKYGIAIAGMHGKTTTTSMVAAVLAQAGLDPTVVVGGRVGAMGSNARLGKSHYLVAEADESDRSFLKLSPILAVITNIDREHMDCYRNMRDVKKAFLDFIDRIPFYGMAVLCNDDPTLRRLASQIKRRTLTYGTRRGSDFLIKVDRLSFRDGQPLSTFQVSYRGSTLGDFTLRVPGAHNVLNATAAIAVAVGLDISTDQIRAAMDDFASAFEGADSLTVLDVYAANEQPVEGITAELLAQKIRDAGMLSVNYAGSFEDAVKAVADRARPGDMVLTLGAGSVSQLGPMLLHSLSEQENAAASTRAE